MIQNNFPTIKSNNFHRIYLTILLFSILERFFFISPKTRPSLKIYYSFRDVIDWNWRREGLLKGFCRHRGESLIVKIRCIYCFCLFVFEYGGVSCYGRLSKPLFQSLEMNVACFCFQLFVTDTRGAWHIANHVCSDNQSVGCSLLIPIFFFKLSSHHGRTNGDTINSHWEKLAVVGNGNKDGTNGVKLLSPSSQTWRRTIPNKRVPRNEFLFWRTFHWN